MKKIFLLIISFIICTTLTHIPARAEEVWKQEGGEWYCFDESGNKIMGSWCRNGVCYYYTDPATGKIVKDRLIDDGFYRYYVGSDGIRVTDKLQKVNLPDRPDGYEWMYFQPETGRAATGEVTISSKQYRFDESGYMLYGLLSENLTPVESPSESTYYHGKRDEGAGYTGWLHVTGGEDINYPDEDSVWFYYSKGKKYVNTSVTLKGIVYKVDENGAMLHGWVQDSSDNWRYYGEADDGVQKINCWVKSDFDFTTKQPGSDTYWYYLGPNGLQKGLTSTEYVAKVDGRFYLFFHGHMVTGPVVGIALQNDFTDQAKFFLEETLTDVYTKSLSQFEKLPLMEEDGSRICVMFFSNDPDDGAMKTGQQEVMLGDDKVTMYFDKHGYALEGIVKDRIYRNGILQKADDHKAAVKELRLAGGSYPAGWYLVSQSGNLFFNAAVSDDDGVYWAATKKPSATESSKYCIYRMTDPVAGSKAAAMLKDSNDTPSEWIDPDTEGYEKMYAKQLETDGKYYNIYRTYNTDAHYFDVIVREAAKR